MEELIQLLQRAITQQDSEAATIHLSELFVSSGYTVALASMRKQLTIEQRSWLRHNRGIPTALQRLKKETGLDFYQLVLDIEASGYTVVSSKQLTYTVGLSNRNNCPEFLVSGYSPELAANLIESTIQLLLVEGKLDLGEPIEIDRRKHIAKQFDFQKHSKLVPFISWYNSGKPTFVAQLVWPDNKGFYPWCKGEYDSSFKQRLYWTSPIKLKVKRASG